MLLEKINKFINKNIIYRGAELTPKGEYFKNYCTEIVNSTLNSKIMSYEDLIDYIRLQLAEIHGIVLNRKETAEFILETYEEIL